MNNSNIIDVTKLYGIWDVKALANYPSEKEALVYLQKLAAQVYPLCLQKKLKVVIFKEFFPVNPGLLGLNVNRTTIYVRLRNPFDKHKFLPWHSMLGTLLHELVHMTIGPHNNEFYKLLDVYWEFIEAEQDKGITGDYPIYQNGVWLPKNYGSLSLSSSLSNKLPVPSFSSLGHRLGSSSSTSTGPSSLLGRRTSTIANNNHHTPNSRNLRNQMLQAAEQRMKKSKLMGKPGGEILGTSNDSHHHHPEHCTCILHSNSSSSSSTATSITKLPTRTEDKRRLLAWAAEQRIEDAYTCGNSQDNILHINETNTIEEQSNTTTSSSTSSSTKTKPSLINTQTTIDTSSSITAQGQPLSSPIFIDTIIINDNQEEGIESIERPIIIDITDDDDEDNNNDAINNNQDDEIIILTDEEKEEIIFEENPNTLGIKPAISPSSSSSSPSITSSTKRIITTNKDTYICTECTYEGSRKGGLALACEICGSILSSMDGIENTTESHPSSAASDMRSLSTTPVPTTTPTITSITSSGNTPNPNISSNENIPPNLLAWKLAAEDIKNNK